MYLKRETFANNKRISYISHDVTCTKDDQYCVQNACLTNYPARPQKYNHTKYVNKARRKNSIPGAK